MGSHTEQTHPAEGRHSVHQRHVGIPHQETVSGASIPIDPDKARCGGNRIVEGILHGNLNRGRKSAPCSNRPAREGSQEPELHGSRRVDRQCVCARKECHGIGSGIGQGERGGPRHRRAEPEGCGEPTGWQCHGIEGGSRTSGVATRVELPETRAQVHYMGRWKRQIVTEVILGKNIERPEASPRLDGQRAGTRARCGSDHHQPVQITRRDHESCRGNIREAGRRGDPGRRTHAERSDPEIPGSRNELSHGCDRNRGHLGASQVSFDSRIID